MASQVLSESRQVLLVDTFRGVPLASESDTRFRGGELSDASATDVEALARRLDLTNVTVLQGKFPDEVELPNEIEVLSLVHIDVDIFESARSAFEAIRGRLIPGSVVVFDDYGFFGCEGVTRSVNSLAVGKEFNFTYNLNGNAVLTKI